MLSPFDTRWKVSHTDGLVLDLDVKNLRRLEFHVTYRMEPHEELLPEDIARAWDETGRDAQTTIQDFSFFLEESDKSRYNPTRQETQVRSVAPKIRDRIEIANGALVFHFYGTLVSDTDLTSDAIEYAKGRIVREQYARIL